jgi:hypothetical protein
LKDEEKEKNKKEEPQVSTYCGKLQSGQCTSFGAPDQSEEKGSFNIVAYTSLKERATYLIRIAFFLARKDSCIFITVYSTHTPRTEQ